MRRIIGWVLLAASVFLILAATVFPFGALAMQIERIPPRWCIACGGLWLTDAISNVVMFVPLGIALALLRVRAVWMLVSALTLTIFVEVMQSLGLPPGRSPALADVLANTIGGALGWVLIRHGRALAFPASWRVAVRLCWGWAACTVALMLATSAALGPRSAVDDAPWLDGAGDVAEPVRYTRSPFPHTPGRPWYGGLIDSALVNGYQTRHRGTGPVIVRASREPGWVYLSARVRGRELAPFQVPMVFLHAGTDSSPVAMIAEADDDAELVVTRLAWDWGLTMPSVRLRGVFAQRGVRDPRVLRISGEASPARLRLSAEGEHAGDRWAVVPLVPTMGWALIQSLIRVDSPWAVLARWGWLAGLLLPVGWWGAQAGGGARRWRVLAVAAAWVGVGGVACVKLFGVSPVPVGDWVVMTVCGVLGWLMAMRLARGPERG